VTVPGRAHAEFQSTADVDALEVLPLAIGQERYAPPAERALRDPRDPSHFSAELWIMTPGTWKVRVRIFGNRGTSELSLPVPALPPPVRAPSLPFALALSLAAGGLFVAALAIVRAGAREAQLPPGTPIGKADARRGRRAVLVAGSTLGSMMLGIAVWWSNDDRRYASIAYRPTGMTAWVDDAGRLFIRLEEPGWLSRRPDDLVADHGHLMHLYAIRLPEFDRVLHLHPDLQTPGMFERDLPPLPAGRYRLFGDFVHQTGLAETAVTEIAVPDIAGKPLAGDDATRELPPLSHAPAANAVELEDGTTLTFGPSEPPVAGRVCLLSFRFGSVGSSEPAALEPYLGMLGHLAVFAHDGSVFSHVHPSGTVPMAALAVARSATRVTECAPPGTEPAARSLVAEAVTFPYQFPHAGGYRLVVQIKRAGRVLTGAFDVQVNAT
jgi:hypothetical protein